MPALTNNAMFRALLVLVLLSPLPLASYRPWAWSVLAVSVGVLLVVWSVGVLLGRLSAPVPLRWTWMVLTFFVLVITWASAQTLDLVPRAWWHPLWGEAASALGRPLDGAVSVDPTLSRTAILRLLSYGGVFWLALQLGRERSRAREALVAVATAGTVYAAYGLSVHFSGQERILWLEKWAYLGDVTSTFVNRNAYAAYAGLGVLSCVALFLHALRRRRAGVERRAYDVTETLLLRALPFLTGAVVIGTALLLTHSRGAFLSTGLALLVLMAVVVIGGLASLRTAVLLGAVIGVVGIGLLNFSGTGTIERLALTDVAGTDRDRAEVYRLTVDAIGDAPWTGHGFGAFLPGFRMYRGTGLPNAMVWDFAHNVHLETVMDLGVPGAAPFYAALGVVLGVCLRGLVRRRRDQIYPAVAIAGTTLIGVHGLVDFSAQMPAVAVTLALLLGIGFAHSWRSADGGGHG